MNDDIKATGALSDFQVLSIKYKEAVERGDSEAADSLIEAVRTFHHTHRKQIISDVKAHNDNVERIETKRARRRA
jgi:ribosomal protein S20